MILHLLLLAVIMLMISSSSPAIAICNRVCKGRNDEIPVRYPFGFSDDCGIRLDCSDAGESRIGEYPVLNLTGDHILVNFPATCDRPFEEIRLFRAQNYALTWRNGLLLENCNASLNDCVVSSRIIKGFLNLPRCESMNNRSINCYSDDNRDPMEFMNMTRLENAGCRGLYSSVAIDSGENSTRPSVTMGFQSVELGWWVDGDCNCHQKAVCKNVSLGDLRVGYRCHCVEGYDGDGFVGGDGCRRVSKCNASKYFSGECGGTTRVGVLIGGAVLGATIISSLALIWHCVKKQKKLKNQMSAKRLLSEATGSFSILSYAYKDIEKATNNFSDKQRLGIGAYGTVYAGKLNSNEWVAVKRIRNRDTDGTDQIMNEIKLISSVDHPNLVRLLGYCIEKNKQILVYEYMPNGTLAQHLQRARGSGLPWPVRLAIATETARAIAHLHTSMSPPIYHRDVKSSNILLDHDFGSKVADFGLSRLGMPDDSHVSTAPQGTPGYVDPQYHQSFHLSDKSDVYSFGVVLVEIITALKVVDFSRAHTEVNLAALAIDKIGKGRVDELIDPFLELNGDVGAFSSIHRVAELAFRCLAFQGDVRPSMTEVADELEQIQLVGTDKPKAASAVVGSRRLAVPHTMSDCLTIIEEEKDSSPVSVHDIWLSDRSSPSTNNLLGNIVKPLHID